MKMRTVFAVGFFGALVASGGCRQDAAWPPEPAPIQFGEDACAACSMIISDPSYAAQIRDRQGKVQIFDDIGCMLAKSKTTTDITGVFVRSADGARWIRGDRAYLVRAKSIPSPMGYGFIAFADSSEAEAAARSRSDAVVVELRTLLGEARPTTAVGPESGLTRLPVKGDVPE